MEDLLTVLAQEAPRPRRLGLEGSAFDRAAIGLVLVFLTGLAVLVAVLLSGRRGAKPGECDGAQEGSAPRSGAGAETRTERETER